MKLSVKRGLRKRSCQTKRDFCSIHKCVTFVQFISQFKKKNITKIALMAMGLEVELI